MRRVIKRSFDLVFGILLGIIAIPILFIACLFVFVCSPESSPIFKQVRVGYKGKEFVMLKLRTMTNKKNANGEFLPDEERLKWWGKIIRKTNIDELTQILHILAGKMSFIGPRPLLPKEMLVMTKKEQEKRQSVLPGIVGWESVNEDKSSSRREMAQFDLYYVDHWSLGMDARIFFLTIYNIFSFRRPDDSLRAPKLSDEEIKKAAEKDKEEIQSEQ
jgi:undecaprenyl phosphate N,N'-diacetylbacillosamine 1-phosphate transferase